MDKLPLSNQVALVTGAGRRIGRVIALELARAGASVIVNYNASRDEAEATVKEIRILGRASLAVKSDVASPRQVERMFQTVRRRFGRLDILVNNAAIFFRVPWDKLTGNDWDRILGINLKGTFFCAQQAALMMMEQKRGRIINISSLGGLQAWPGYMHYCSSKAAVVMLTKCLAMALAPHILVNTIAPGTILLPGEKPSKGQKASVRSTPLNRAGRAEDIAEMVLHLATGADYVTGQVFPVDGGKSIP
ncbi:MAG TPA: 3-oxoacyl-ACP reductase family protein [Terriglobia bacterium]|nr:3-oxoacyl-ACP reductase family protein [Terriglobia bacterium]